MPIKAIIESFRIKSLEAIRCTKREEGQKPMEAGATTWRLPILID